MTRYITAAAQGTPDVPYKLVGHEITALHSFTAGLQQKHKQQ
jgi:hypothetical protein